MADFQPPSAPPQAQPVAERERRFDLLKQREQMRKEAKEQEEQAIKEFDQDFDDLKEVSDQITTSPQAVNTPDGIVVKVQSALIDEVIVRRIEQELRFEAEEDYPLEPRYEITINYYTEDGNMADSLLVTLEEIHEKSLDERIKVIHKRMIEAIRKSKSVERYHRVWATHLAKEYPDGNTQHEIRSEGQDIKKPFDYDRLVELEVKKAIDAIRTALDLAALPEKLKQA